MSLEGDHRVQPLLQTPFDEQEGTISPDGRWIAYESDSSGRLEIYVRPFPAVAGGQWQVSTVGGRRPLWARDGQELFYLAPTGALMRVPVEVRSTVWSAGTPVVLLLLQGRYFTGTQGRTYVSVGNTAMATQSDVLIRVRNMIPPQEADRVRPHLTRSSLPSLRLFNGTEIVALPRGCLTHGGNPRPPSVTRAAVGFIAGLDAVHGSHVPGRSSLPAG